MPNWCNGDVTVEGKPKDIEGFCKLFIFENEEGKDTKKRYFARSFIHYKDFKTFKESELDGSNNAQFMVEFAWSGHSCLIEGYPTDRKQKNFNRLITLSKACKEFKVNVTITTEEQGLGFSEVITCNSKGKFTEVCEDLPSFKCKCGNEQTFGSYDDKSDTECCDCGKVGEWL